MEQHAYQQKASTLLLYTQLTFLYGFNRRVLGYPKYYSESSVLQPAQFFFGLDGSRLNYFDSIVKFCPDECSVNSQLGFSMDPPLGARQKP